VLRVIVESDRLVSLMEEDVDETQPNTAVGRIPAAATVMQEQAEKKVAWNKGTNTAQAQEDRQASALGQKRAHTKAPFFSGFSTQLRALVQSSSRLVR
jgi:hypothetical protein